MPQLSNGLPGPNRPFGPNTPLPSNQPDAPVDNLPLRSENQFSPMPNQPLTKSPQKPYFGPNRPVEPDTQRVPSKPKVIFPPEHPENPYTPSLLGEPLSPSEPRGPSRPTPNDRPVIEEPIQPQPSKELAPIEPTKSPIPAKPITALEPKTSGCLNEAEAKALGLPMPTGFYDYPTLSTELPAESFRNRVRNICRSQLGGAWYLIEPERMEFHEIPRTSAVLKSRARTFSCGMPPSLASFRTILKDGHVRFFNKELVIGQKSASQEAAIVSFLTGAQGPKTNGFLLPRVLSTFYGGLVSEATPSKFITQGQMRDPTIADDVARKVAAIHALPAPTSRSYEMIYGAMEGFLLEAKANAGRLPPSPEQDALNLLVTVPWEAEINYVHNLMVTVDSPIVFCLNNLGPNNILIRSAPASDVVFNSFEYSGYNHRSFDLADYLIESTIESKPGPNNQIIFSQSVLPQETISSFLNAYYRSVAGNLILQKSYRGLYDEYLRGRLASHLYWGLWALYSTTHSPEQANVLLSYAQFRLESYLIEKDSYPKSAAALPNAAGQVGRQGPARVVSMTEPYFNSPHYRPWRERYTPMYV